MKHPNQKRNFNNLPVYSYRVLTFFLEFLILLICIGFMQMMYDNDILPDKTVKESFLQTPCVVLSKKLSEKGKVVHHYRADFLISYTANNNPYQAWVTGNGLDQSFFLEREPQQDALDQFGVNASYTCWYNPETPQIAVLVLRHNWTSTLPLAVPTIIGLIMIYYMLKNIMQFFGALHAIRHRPDQFKK